jgi:LacI family transcriptional regulator
MSKNATLAEVAKRAGVIDDHGVAGHARPGPRCRGHAQEGAGGGGRAAYTPDVLAQTMRGGSSRLIGVFLVGFHSMVLHDLLVGIENEAHRLG